MNKYLEQLIQLQKIDIEIDSFTPRIAEARGELDSVLGEQKEMLKKVEKLNDEIKNAELDKRKNELHLEELIQKLDDWSKKSNEVKSEREIQALQLEEDIAKEQVDFANEEIARLEKLKETKEDEIKELEESLTKINEKVSKIEEQTNAKLKEIELEKHDIYKKRQELLANMTQNIIVFYEKIRRWAGNTTVVAVKKQACYGCYMKINDHTYSEVIKGEEITTCPHCGRILYLEKETEEATQEA